MKTNKIITNAIFIALLAIMLTSCSKSSSDDSPKPITPITSDATKNIIGKWILLNNTKSVVFNDSEMVWRYEAQNTDNHFSYQWDSTTFTLKTFGKYTYFGATGTKQPLTVNEVLTNFMHKGYMIFHSEDYYKQ